MLIPVSVKIPPALRDDIENVADYEGVTVSALIRGILTDTIGSGSEGAPQLNSQLQFNISLAIKTLYLARFIAESIDKEASEKILGDADTFISRNGLIDRPATGAHTGNADHG